MSVLSHVFTVSAIGVSTLPQRRGTSLVIVLGVACVVGVLVSMLSVTVGLRRMSLAGGSDGHAIVLPKDARGEFGSSLTPGSAGLIMNAPGVAKGPDGAPLADAELVFGMTPPPGLVVRDFVNVRGIGPTGAAIRDDFRIESGRMLRTGTQELLIGAAISRRFGLKTGDKLLMPGGFWPIVGTFSTGGDSSESQFFADANTLMAATQRSQFGSVIVKLANPQAFDEFQRWVTTNPSLSVDAYRVSDYLSRNNAEQMAVFTRASYVIGIIMALGALFGATKIMYAAVRARTREIGTLRALGFGGTSVTISVLLESTLLALIGAALGVLLAWLLFEGREVNSSGIFRLHVSAPLVAIGLAWGALIALLGGLFPAVRAGKIAAATALRAA